MRKLPIYTVLHSLAWFGLLAVSMLFADGQVCRAQSQIGDVERNFQYQPDGNALVCVNGKNRFTRALYGDNTAYRLETSDRPEFVVTNGKKGMNLRCYAKVDGKEFALDSTDICEARYDARQRVYTLRDARLGGGLGTLTLTAIATKKGEGALWKFEAKGIGRHLVIEMRRHNIKAKKLSRSGDMGLESPGYFDAAGPCLQSVEIRPSKGEYIYIENDTLYVLDKKRGNQMYDEAYAACNALADNISISTPDVYLNPLGGAMMMAADGTWDGKVWNHGAVGWRMPLPGWRGAYMGDFLGMFERQRTHLDAYAKSQVTDVPVTQPHLMDSTHNLARGTYQWGTPLYSNGYICRNPENNHQMHHYDMNLVYVDELLWHFQFDADTAYMRQMWPLLVRHLAWEKNTFDPDGDHLYDAYCCIWASDALQYSGGAGTHSSAYNYRGNLLAALIAEHIGEDPVPYREEAAAIRQAMNERLWVEDADNKLENTGHWAEYQDFLGNRLVHKHPALWSLYTPIDCGVCTPEQAFACTRYIDRYIPHIGFEDGKRYQTISTSSWAPYEWSLNNVVFAEVMHTALAYYLSGRNDAAYELLSGCVADFMYMGNSPANFGQLSALDVSTGERYRDFADGIGMASRALIQGLFGITPQALEGKCIVRPGFPSSWDHASIKTPYMSYSFERKEGKDIFTITQNFAQPLRIVIRQNLENGQYRDYEFDDKKQQTISIPTYLVHERGDRTLKPLSANEGCDFAEVEGARCQMVNIDNTLNAQVTDIFKNKYLSPRSPYTTLALPTQGIGDWCATKRTANIDDSGIRKEALENGQVFRASMGTTEASAIPFRTTDAGRNVAYMSLWDNYPDSITFALAGRASHAYLMMVGSTNPMQSQFDNALVYVTYADGTTDSLTLRNPDNWCPIEQDYTHDGRAFRLPEPLPYRFSLKNGQVSRTLAKELNHDPVSLTSDVPSQKHPVYKIEGGAGQLLDLPLDPNKELRTLTVKTIANDVVIGLMAITLQRP